MKRRKFLKGLAGAAAIIAWPDLQVIGQEPVDSPEKRSAYFRELLHKLCVEIGPRRTGTPAYARAVEVIRKEMSRTLSLVEIDEFQLTAWELVGKARLAVGNQELETFVYDGSPSTPAEGIKGILVRLDTPEGKPSESHFYLKDLDDDKIKAGLQIAPFGKAIASSLSGPLETRKPVFGVGIPDRPVLEKALAEKTPVIVSAQTRFIPDAWGANAIGTIPGKTEEEIFLVAHLDSQYNAPGAHDNAASVIVMVMLAHALARSQPQKTLRFVATGAEEVGCLGAAHYAERREKEKNLSRVKFCFNFDSLTYGPNLHFSVMDEELKQLVLAAHKDLGMQSKSQALEIKGFSMDDAPFWRAGARTIHFNSRGIEANLGYWHRPDDTPDKVDFKIADAAFRVLLEFIRRVDRL